MPAPPEQSGPALADHLRSRGIADPRVLEAMASVPRDRFVPEDAAAMSWRDQALPIACGQTISQPFMVALMTQELALRGSERVLEVGTGSGYQAAILARLAAEVHTIERIEDLARSADQLLRLELGIENVRVHVGDGSLGWPSAAPFDRIIVTAGTPELPAPLFEQLADGGLIVAPIGSAESQQLRIIERRGNVAVEHPSVTCRFVPLIGQRGWADPSADH